MCVCGGGGGGTCGVDIACEPGVACLEGMRNLGFVVFLTSLWCLRLALE